MKHNFKELNAWKESMTLTTVVYQSIGELPVEERFGLSSQLKRSAVSIPSNIAEGSSKKSIKEFLRFLEIAKGSSYEVETQLILISRLYSNIQIEESFHQLDIAQKNIQGLINSLKKRLH